jgi:CheY-like chemotaxis protein
MQNPDFNTFSKLIFMDINMPELDGIQATEIIKTEFGDQI